MKRFFYFLIMYRKLVSSGFISFSDKIFFIPRYVLDYLFYLLDKKSFKELHFLGGRKFTYFGEHKNLLLDHIYSNLSGYCKYYTINAKTIIDVGASFGTFSLMVNYLNPSAKIISIEMDGKSYDYLQKNCSDIKNIETLHVAAGDVEKEVIYYQDNSYPEGSFIPDKSFISQEATKDNLIRIKQTTLDNIIKIRKLKEVSLVKVDIEGYELKLLEGADYTLKITDHFIIETSTDLNQLIKVLSFMNKYNFKLIDFGDIGYDKELIGAIDLIFKRK